MKIFKFKNHRGGFTLIELLVVVAIISLLSSVVLASLNGARMKARDVKRKSDLLQIRTALEMYYNDNNGSYPNTAGYFNNANHGGLDAALTPTYISKISDDPQFPGHIDYIYMRKDYTADGEPSGFSANKYALYATLENPTSADIATLSDAYDLFIKILGPANYRIGN